MKQFIKGRWFPLVVVLACGAGLMGVLFWNGFRVTYAPELENSWDAISACAAWAGVVMSFVAIIFAIRIPTKIADRQDKIALFEKRSEIFSEIQKYYIIAKSIEDGESVDGTKIIVHYAFGINDFTMEGMAAFLYTHSIKFIQIPYLFPGISNEDCLVLSDAMSQYWVQFIEGMPEDKNCAMQYAKSITRFCSKYDRIFEDCLSLDKKR